MSPAGPVESGPGYRISERREVFRTGERLWLSLSSTAASHGLLDLAPARAGEVRDRALGILNELDGHFAHAGQESGLRARHEQLVSGIRIVLHNQLIAGDRDHDLPS